MSKSVSSSSSKATELQQQQQHSASFQRPATMLDVPAEGAERNKGLAEMRNVPSNSADAYDTTFCLSMDPSLTCDVLIYA